MENTTQYLLIQAHRLKLGLARFGRDERGLSTVEYVILLVLIAVATISLWTTFGGHLERILGSANTDMEKLGK